MVLKVVQYMGIESSWRCWRRDTGCPAQRRRAAVREGCLEEVVPQVSVFLSALSCPLGSWEPWSPGSELVSRSRTPNGSVVPKASRPVGALWPLTL